MSDYNPMARHKFDQGGIVGFCHLCGLAKGNDIHDVSDAGKDRDTQEDGAEEYNAVEPPHYKGFSNGAEVIDIVENLNFNRGSAIKYLARAGSKDVSKEIEDLQKASWYITREIERLSNK